MLAYLFSIKFFRKFFLGRYRKKLRDGNPDYFWQKSEEKVLKTFHSAAVRVPAYQQLLKRKGIESNSIDTIKKFKENVPVISKKDTFMAYGEKIHLLCRDGNLEDLDSILSSSGYSGNFSYGLITRGEMLLTPYFIDFALDMNFGVESRKTLLINCLPMGVRVPSSATVTADTSVRKDMALSLVRNFGKQYELIVIVGENTYIKELLEYGIENGISWADYNVRLIVGEEGFPETYRSYIASLLDVDIDSQTETYIGSSMGVSELGLTVFQENYDTIRIRREAERNDALRYSLFGAKCQTSPMLFSYNPLMVYLEENQVSSDTMHANDLLFSTVESEAKLPLIRYATGDRGNIIKYETLAGILEHHGLEYLLPTLKLPLVAVAGRQTKIEVNGQALDPELIKFILYQDLAIASCITGNFKMSSTENSLNLKIQLKKSVPMGHDQLVEKIGMIIAKNISIQYNLFVYSFEDFPYPLNHERKLNYLEE